MLVAGQIERVDMKSFNMPLTQEEIDSLELYEQIYLSGDIYVGRDQVHLKLYNLIKQGRELPFDLNNQAIYYMGPSGKSENALLGAAGPTTSARMDPFTPLLMDNGLKILIGKGPRNKEVKEAIKRNKGLYLISYGGCGALYGSLIKESKIIAYKELKTEALLKIKVLNFPLMVAITSKGDYI